MPKTETLDERATRVAAETAAVQTEMAERAQAEADRQALAQRQADEAAVASWDPRALDAAVEGTSRDVTSVVESMPLVRALAEHLAAQTRRQLAWTDHLAALGRLGRPTAGAQMPSASGRVDVQDLIERAVDNIGHDLAFTTTTTTTTTTEEKP